MATALPSAKSKFPILLSQEIEDGATIIWGACRSRKSEDHINRSFATITVSLLVGPRFATRRQ